MHTKEFLQQLKGRFMNIHVPSGQSPIFIFAAPRSGSTLLLEMLALEPGLKVLNEPLSINKAAARRELGVSDWRAATIMTERESTYGLYFEKLLANKLPELNTPFYRRRGRFVTDRVAFKILHGGEDMVPWFRERFSAKIVILVRHPIPTTLSHRKFPRLPHFLGQKGIRSRLTKAQIRLVENTIEHGKAFEKGIVNWCLQYALMLDVDREDDWLMVPYEDLILRPTATIHYLSQGLQLRGTDTILASRDRPSLSSRQSDKDVLGLIEQMGRGDATARNALLERWTTRVDRSMERHAFDILDAFGIDCYEHGSVVPSACYRVPEHPRQR